jgi:hypothetical protein
MKAQREREREKSERGKREEASYIKRGGGVKWSHQSKKNVVREGAWGLGPASFYLSKFSHNQITTYISFCHLLTA